MAPIAGQVSTCFAAFHSLIATRPPEVQPTGDPRSTGNQFSVARIEDELARFKVWSANIGAHRGGRSSLDFRLRDTSRIRLQVLQLLRDLSESLNEGKVFWLR